MTVHEHTEGIMNAETSTTLVCATRPSHSPAISVIIPARNEERVIARCLQALADQTIPRELMEVLLVDNGSIDNTIAVAQSFSERLLLTILHRPGLRISALRNAGARHSHGKILAFLDADCVPRPDWLETVLTSPIEKQQMVLGCDYLIPPDSSWVARAWCSSPGSELKDVSFVPAGDLIINRDAFDRLDGFNE